MTGSAAKEHLKHYRDSDGEASSRSETLTHESPVTTRSAGDGTVRGDDQTHRSTDETLVGSYEPDDDDDDTIEAKTVDGNDKPPGMTPIRSRWFVRQEERAEKARLKLQERVDSWVDDPEYLSEMCEVWSEPRPRTPNSDSGKTDEGSGEETDSRLITQNRLSTELKICQARSDCPPIMPCNEETRTVRLPSPSLSN